MRKIQWAPTYSWEDQFTGDSAKPEKPEKEKKKKKPKKQSKTRLKGGR